MGVFKEREVSFIHAWIKDTNIQKHLYLLLIINILIKAACLPRNIVNSCNLRLFDVAKQHSNYAHLHRTCTDTGELLSTFKSSSSNQNQAWTVFYKEHCTLTKSGSAISSFVEELEGDHEESIRSTQHRLKSQKLLEGDQPDGDKQTYSVHIVDTSLHQPGITLLNDERVSLADYCFSSPNKKR